MEAPQRTYLPYDYFATPSLVPCQMRQKLYDLSLNLRVYVFDKNIMNILEEEVEIMFTSVDELEKVMHKLDTQIAELDDNDLLTTAVSLTDADCLAEIFETDEDINHHIPYDVCPEISALKNRFDASKISANSTDTELTFCSKANVCCNMMEDELNVIYQKVVFLIKEMEKNMERLERIMKKFMISGPQPQNKD